MAAKWEQATDGSPLKKQVTISTRVETSTRTRVDVRRVPGIAGLPRYLVFITMDVSYAAQ